MTKPRPFQVGIYVARNGVVSSYYSCDRHTAEEIPALLNICIETLQAERAKLLNCPAVRKAAEKSTGGAVGR